MSKKIHKCPDCGAHMKLIDDVYICPKCEEEDDEVSEFDDEEEVFEEETCMHGLPLDECILCS